MSSETMDRFRECLDRAQAIPEGQWNRCKHGEGLYECMEDCEACFVEAIEAFAAGHAAALRQIAEGTASNEEPPFHRRLTYEEIHSIATKALEGGNG